MASSTPSSPVRIVAMASGSGTNLQALIDAIAAEPSPIPTPVEVVHLIVNRRRAFAADRASRAGITSEYFNLIGAGFQKAGEKDPDVLAEARGRYDVALAERVLSCRPDLVVLLGWMHVFTEAFLRPLEAKGVRCVNLHPALPGKYDGANALERAYQDFQEGKLEGNKTGCMVHYVIAEVDRGEPILIQELEIQPGEQLAQLEERLHAAEHDIVVKATAKVVAEIAEEKSR